MTVCFFASVFSEEDEFFFEKKIRILFDFVF